MCHTDYFCGITGTVMCAVGSGEKEWRQNVLKHRQ